MKTIPLTRGLVALVDDEDYEWLMQWKWHATRRGYAARNSSAAEGPRRRTIQMHVAILGVAPEFHSDHKNGNRLDNQRDNLRHATRLEQSRNCGVRKDSVSRYRGVNKHHTGGRWRARIWPGSKSVELGLYRTREEAALAYNEAAVRLYGEFARLNEVPNAQTQ